MLWHAGGHWGRHLFSRALLYFALLIIMQLGEARWPRPTGTVLCNKANLQAPNVSARLADLLIVGLFLLGEWRPNEGLLSSYFRFLCLFMTRRRRIFGPFLFMTEETDKSAMWKYCIRQLFATTYWCPWQSLPFLLSEWLFGVFFQMTSHKQYSLPSLVSSLLGNKDILMNWMDLYCTTFSLIWELLSHSSGLTPVLARLTAIMRQLAFVNKCKYVSIRFSQWKAYNKINCLT